MAIYKKPIVLLNEELAEGIYAASGDVAGGSDSSITASSPKLTNEGNEWYKYNAYSITLSNNGSEVATDWTVSVEITDVIPVSVTTNSSWIVDVSLSGNRVVITSNGGGTISAGSAVNVEIVVGY